MMQQLFTAALVLACSVYAGWVLMPAAARNWLRTHVLRRPAQAADGCGACGGCAGAQPPARSTTQHVVQVLRR